MSICHLITILSLALLIQTSHPFKPPKHNIISYYKTVNNVFLTNPENHSTSYGIYVAGETTTVDIPSNVANVYDIVSWKVVNVDKDRLMFVHNNKPQILIDQQRIREMNYSGELSDSIISLGDSEALHVPTIVNDPLTPPSHKWNYLELLYFDGENESVRVIDSLPWLKDDDWKFIKEWKMMDYIHMYDKLYLLIKRSIWNEKASNVTQEISIIRLCLDIGNEFISSAVEVHFTQPELQNIQIIEAIFRYDSSVSNGYDVEGWRDAKPRYGDYPNWRYDLFITLDTVNRDRKHFHTVMFHERGDDDDVFDIVERMFAAGTKSSDLNLLQYHLRSESSECKKSIDQPCFLDGNTIPSFDAKEKTRLDVSYLEFSGKIHENQGNTVKHQGRDAKPSYVNDPNRRYDLFITLDTPNHDRKHFDIHLCNSCYDDIFNMVEGMIASGTNSSDLNLLQYHLRSESSECKKFIDQPCFADGNTIASFDAEEKADVYESIHENQSNTVKHQSIMFGHPFSRWLFLHIQNPLSKSGLYTSFHCGIDYTVFDRYYCQSIEVMEQKWKRLNIDVEQQFFVNQRPFGGFFITKKSHEIIFFNFNLICVELNSCVDCIMYGFYFNCVWSHETPTLPKCKYDDQPKDKTALTVNFCFKIISFSSSTIINSSVQQTLSIQLDTDLYVRETLTIQAGPDNYCTNITVHWMLKGLTFQCSMNSLKSGNFNIEVSLTDDKTADVTMISAVSTGIIHIIVPESGYKTKSDKCNDSSTIITSTTSTTSIIITLFSCLFLCLCLFVAFKRCGKQKLTRIREFC